MGANKFILAACLAAMGASAAPSLRFAAANNYYPNTTTNYNVQTGSATAQMVQQGSFVIGQDCTSLTIGFGNQYMAASQGITNTGNAIAFQQFAAVYNGIVVNVTLGGAMPVTVADAANAFFDAIPCSAFSVAKFSKGTTVQLRFLISTSAQTTDKFPVAGANSLIYGVSTECYYFDPLMAHLTTGVYATGNIGYAVNSANATGATASGTTVTVTMASTALFVNGNTYVVSGATGTGTALNYNGTFVVTVVNSTTLTYTALSAPAATATGTLLVSARNGTDARFGIAMALMLLAPHTLPAIGMLGDSKTFGTGDTLTTSGAIGMSRLLFSNPSTISTVVAAGCNFGNPSGIGSDPYTTHASGNLATFEQWYSFMNHAVVGYGTNNLSTSFQTALYARLRANGISGIIQRSLTPRTIGVPVTALSGNGTLATLTASSAFVASIGTTGATANLVLLGVTGGSYNTSATGATFTVASSTTLTYASTSTATANLTSAWLIDDWRTTANQVTNPAPSSWGVGSSADTYEATLRGWITSDPNLTYYQSQGERSSPTAGTAGYWLWLANGTSFYGTPDGLHESAVNYENNIGTAGIVMTGAGGNVSQSLRALVATLT